MIIFIDESGIHKQTGHATTAIVYIEIDNADETVEVITKLQEKLRISYFHWGEERWKVRNKFLENIIDLDFTFKVAIFEKPVHPENMIEVVFRHLITEDTIDNIYIDGKKPRWYEQRLKKVLRDRGISVKKLRTLRGRSHPGIQLADAIAGLIRRYYDYPDEPDIKRWFKRLKRENKMIGEFIFDPEAVQKLLSEK